MADLVPNIPSRTVTIDAADITEQKAMAGGKVTATLVCDLNSPVDGKIIAASTTTITLDSAGHGEFVTLPCWDGKVTDHTGSTDWGILITKSWHPNPRLVRVPAGSGPIALGLLPEVRKLSAREAKYALTTVAVTATTNPSAGSVSATGSVVNGQLALNFAFPPAGPHTHTTADVTGLQGALDTMTTTIDIGQTLVQVTASSVPAAGVKVGQLKGFQNASGNDIVVAGYVLQPGTVVILEWDGAKWVRPNVVPAALALPDSWVPFGPAWDTSRRTYTIPQDEGATYAVNGTPTPAGIYLAPASGTTSIEATPASGYVFSGTATHAWSYTWAASSPAAGEVITSDSFNRPNGPIAGSLTDNYSGGVAAVWAANMGAPQIYGWQLTSHGVDGQPKLTLPAQTAAFDIDLTIATLPAITREIRLLAADGSYARVLVGSTGGVNITCDSTTGAQESFIQGTVAAGGRLRITATATGFELAQISATGSVVTAFAPKAPARKTSSPWVAFWFGMAGTDPWAIDSLIVRQR